MRKFYILRLRRLWKKNIFAPFLVVFLVFSLFTVSLLAFIWPVDVVSLANAGMLGDSFAVLNTAFSGLALAAIVVTLAYQQEQLRMQKEELRATQEELSRQTKLFDQQKFDATFFSILKMTRDNLESITQVAKDGATYRGVDLLKERLGELGKTIKGAELGDFPDDEDSKVVYFWNFWKLAHQSLGRQKRYVDTLGELIDWVHLNCPDGVDKGQYYGIISSQLTYIECHYIFYQIMFSAPDHPLRSRFDLNNKVFVKVSSFPPSRAYIKILAWVVGLDAGAFKLKADAPIEGAVVSRSKKAISKRRA